MRIGIATTAFNQCLLGRTLEIASKADYEVALGPPIIRKPLEQVLW